MSAGVESMLRRPATRLRNHIPLAVTRPASAHRRHGHEVRDVMAAADPRRRSSAARLNAVQQGATARSALRLPRAGKGRIRSRWTTRKASGAPHLPRSICAAPASGGVSAFKASPPGKATTVAAGHFVILSNRTYRGASVRRCRNARARRHLRPALFTRRRAARTGAATAAAGIRALSIAHGSAPGVTGGFARLLPPAGLPCESRVWL